MKSLKPVFFTAAFFYLFIAPFFFHPDIKIIYYLSQFLSHGVLNIYEFISQNPDKATLGPFVYPPLAYFIMGLIQPLVRLFAGPDFGTWLGMGNDAVGLPLIFRYLFLIKIPLIAAVLVTGGLLARLVPAPNRRLLLWLWFFNPVTIYTVGFMGQMDIFPVLLTVWALLLAKDRPYISVLLLGLGGALKTYPLLLLPFTVILIPGNFKKSLSLFLVGLAPYVLTILPFLTTPAFYSDTFASGLTQRLFGLSLSLGFSENLYIIPIIIGILFLFVLTHHRGEISRLTGYFLILTLLPIALCHFHPQWVLWSTPFVCLWMVINKNWFTPVLLWLGFLGVIFLFADRFLIWGLISPFNPDILFLPTPTEVLRATGPFIQSVSHSIFVVAAIWISWKSFKAVHD